MGRTNRAWNTVVSRIQFSAERDEMMEFGIALARVEGYMRAREKGGSLAELAEARSRWIRLGR